MPTIGLAIACATIATQAINKLLAVRLAPGVVRQGILPGPNPRPDEPQFPEFGGNRARIAKDNVIVHTEPSTDAEKVVTVDIGRKVEVLARKDGWYKVRFEGGTSGWVRGDMLSAPKGVNVLAKNAPKGIPLTPEGPNAKDATKKPSKVVIEIDGDEEPDAAPLPDLVAKPAPAAPRDPAPVLKGNGVDVGDLIETAKSKLGSPYVWGATGSRGSFDCSGFVGWVYARYGVDLPRTSIEQSGAGEPVRRSELQPGDLVFFHTRGGDRVSHVGIYIGNNNFIHASSGGGHVKISSLDEAYYDRNYQSARRVVKTAKALSANTLAVTPLEDGSARLRRQAADDEKSKKTKPIGVDIVAG